MLTAIMAGEHSRLLCVADAITEVRYNLDAGAEVSVPLTNSNDRLHEPVLNFQAANGKPISIYGERYVYLNVS